MSKLDQKKIEDKWQKVWKEEKTFQPKVDNKKEKFFITVAYPYANSAMHIGHGRTFTMADIIARYQRVNGKQVLYPMAYHISGTPVLAVADNLSRKDPKQIKQTREAIEDYIPDKKKQDKLIETFKDPFKIAEFFSGKIEETFDSIGLSIDWSRQFTTGDKIYNKFIEWQYKKLHELGILIQGKYPILYSVQDKNAVGEDDIKDGDIDKVTLSEMTYIMFQIKGTDDHLVCGTLRPDSIFGATNVFVKPEMDLVKLNVENKIWIVSKASQSKIEHQFDNVELIEELKGKDLLDKEVIVPILDKEVPVYKADFCDENHGTGLVYSSPADSVHDYLYLYQTLNPGKDLSKETDKEPLNLTPITKTRDKKGNEIKYKFDIPSYSKLFEHKIFKSEGNLDKLEQIKQELYKEAHFGATMINCKEFDGTPLKNGQGAAKVKAQLIKQGLGGTFYETSRRATTRSGDNVIVANLSGQWFLNYSEDKIKQAAYDVLDRGTYLPEKLKETQRGYLKWVEMRPCARRRGLGTKLPYDQDWIIEPLSDSTIYQMLYLVHHIIDRENIKPEQLDFEVFDYVYLGKGNLTMISEESNISKEILNEMKAEVDYWEGLDIRYTNMGHMSNHLSFLIYHYGLIFPEKNWPKNITIGGYLIKDGAKISKSKGNGVPLIRMKETYGIDMYRLYIAIASNFDIEMDFRDDDIFQLEKKFTKWKSLIEGSIKVKKRDYKSFSQTNKWLISKFYSNAKNYFKFFDDMRIREAFVDVLYEFLNDISYHERRTSEKETLEVIRFIAEDYILLMSPAVPHVCEEFNEKFGNKTRASLNEFKTDCDKFISKEAQDLEGISEKLLKSISSQRDSKNIKQIKKIQIVQASDERFKLFDEIKSLLKKKKNVKEMFTQLNKDFEADKKFIQKFVPKTLGEGISFYMSKKDEKEFLSKLIPFFEKEFNTKVEIVSNEDLEQQIYSIPSEPGIILF